MRGTIEDLPGVTSATVEPGKYDIVVCYRPAETNVAALLAGLEEAGQSAKAR